MPDIPGYRTYSLQQQYKYNKARVFRNRCVNRFTVFSNTDLFKI